MLVIILLVGISFSQSPSDLRQLSQEIFDIAVEMRQQAKLLQIGEIEGMTLTQQQEEELSLALQIEMNMIRELLGESGGSIINPQVFVLLESLLSSDGVVFYYRNRDENEQKVRDVLQLLKE